MELLRKEDEQLIQNMIDGNLSDDEIDKFEKLMASSMAARKMYAGLMHINTALVSNAQNIKKINFSDRIMQLLNAKNSFANKPKQTIQFRLFSAHTKTLTYAAILLTGLIFGSVITYLGTSTGSTPDYTAISGTIAPLTDNYNYFDDKTTKIDLQQTLYGSLQLHTVTIETKEDVHLQIIFSDKKEMKENTVNLLYSKGVFLEESTNEKLASYKCNGIAIFQVAKDVTSSNSEIAIQFKRKGTIIKELGLK